MTAVQLDACLDRLRWTKADLARELACDFQIIRRWMTGARVPDAVEAWLLRLCAYHDLHPPPTNWRKRVPDLTYRPHMPPLSKDAEKDRRKRHAKYRSCSRHRAKLKGAKGNHTLEQVERLATLQKWRCATCLLPLDKGYHVDHMQALAKGGSNDIANIQLLCPPCNWRKSAKDPFKWAFENGRLL